MKLYISLAWRNLWRNKRRSLISIASILFAVVIALATRSMQLGVYARMIDNIVAYYSGYAQIQDTDYKSSNSINDSFNLTDSLLTAISNVPNITKIVPRIESFGLLSSGDITDGAMIVGIDPEREQDMTGLADRVILGNYISQQNSGILLAEELANHLQLTVGDTVLILSQGFHGATAAGKYTVVGIVRFPSPELNTRLSYLPIAEAERLFDVAGRVTSVAIMVKKPKQLDWTIDKLKQIVPDGYVVLSWKEMMPEVVEFIELDSSSGVIMLLIIYIVIGFGILGTMLMMTMERQREFGMLIAVGMKRSRLRMVILFESIFLSLIGVFSGIVAGFPLLLYFYFNPIKFTGDYAEYYIKYGFEPIMPFSLDPGIFLNQTLAVLILALLASIYPLWRIGIIKPVTALRTG